MNSDQLPPDLRELEDRLAHRPGPEPSPEFRTRLLSAAGEAPRRGRGWRVAGWAAALLMLMNIGMSLANGWRYHRLAELTNVERPPMPESVDSEDPLDRYAASALGSLSPSASSGSLDRSVFSR